MTVTVESFRAAYDEFSDPADYSDTMINGVLTTGALLMNAQRWGNLFDLGLSLRSAHFLALRRRSMLSAQGGGVPGIGMGVINSKSVDKVRIGFDVKAGTLDGEGQWNLTVYGIEYIQLAEMVGMGGVQISPTCPPGVTGTGSDWFFDGG